MSSNRFNPLGPLSRSPKDNAGQSSAAALPAARPSDSSQQPQAQAQRPQPQPEQPPKKRKGHRAGKKKRQRRKSFAILDDENRSELGEASGEGLYQIPSANLSGTSIDSEALLDHRCVLHLPSLTCRPIHLTIPPENIIQCE